MKNNPEKSEQTRHAVSQIIYLEKMMDKVVEGSTGLPPKTIQAIWQARRLIQMESFDLCFAEALKPITIRNLNIN